MLRTFPPKMKRLPVSCASCVVPDAGSALVAALLPTLIRLRHPCTQLAYFHLMLIACLLLPFLLLLHPHRLRLSPLSRLSRRQFPRNRPSFRHL